MADLDDGSVRTLARLALSLCCLSALACVWELSALQVPDSPFHFGVLSGPIVQLRNFSFALGLGALGLSAVWRRLYAQGEGRWQLWTLVGAALVQVAALTYAAANGMVGVQLLDPRVDARVVVYVRLVGHAALLVGLGALLVRVWRRR
ncbi:MAG TPA: hypothetical protein VFZ61_14290 [Polyangiales bacterium]